MLTLIIGGARSGKSDLAQRIASASERKVLFIATMEPGDDEMRAKIAAHRAARPGAWSTVEAPLHVEEALEGAARGGIVVLDCVTLWVTNMLLAGIRVDGDTAAADGDGTAGGGGTNAVTAGNPGTGGGGYPTRDVQAAVDEAIRRAGELADAMARYAGDVIVVSNEVGMGLVPPYPIGRAFRDALGGANRAIAARADRVYAVVAGLAVEMKAMGAVPVESFGAEQWTGVPGEQAPR